MVKHSSKILASEEEATTDVVWPKSDHVAIYNKKCLKCAAK